MVAHGAPIRILANKTPRSPPYSSEVARIPPLVGCVVLLGFGAFRLTVVVVALPALRRCFDPRWSSSRPDSAVGQCVVWCPSLSVDASHEFFTRIGRWFGQERSFAKGPSLRTKAQ